MNALCRYLFPAALIAIVLTFTSCTQTRILVYDTNSDNVPQVDGQWISDNDTLLIAYSFWAEGGKLACVIFNKTDRQLFIDWKNSAFILNNRKVELWTDAVQFSSISRGSAYSFRATKTTSEASTFNWEWLTRSIGTQYSTGITAGTLVSNERITSIPPRAYIGLERFVILDTPLFPQDGQEETITEPSYTKKGRNESVGRAMYTVTTTPLQFRLFLAYAFYEDMRVQHTLTNSFWLQSISDMSFRHFEGKVLSREPDGTVVYEKPRKNRKSFYWRYTK